MTTIPASGITHQPRTWTHERILALGSATDIDTAAQILGIGRTLAYQLAKDGEFPVPIFRAGRLYRVPVAGLLALLRWGEQPGPGTGLPRRVSTMIQHSRCTVAADHRGAGGIPNASLTRSSMYL